MTSIGSREVILHGLAMLKSKEAAGVTLDDIYTVADAARLAQFFQEREGATERKLLNDYPERSGMISTARRINANAFLSEVDAELGRKAKHIHETVVRAPEY